MLLLSTSSLHGYWLHRVFDFAKKTNYDWLDLALTNLNFDLWDEEYIKNLSDDYKLPVLSITAPSKWINEKKVDKIVSIAKKLWTQLITFSPPHFSDKNITWFTKYLSKVKRSTHISICIQNVEPKFILFIIPEHKNSTLYEIKKVTWDTSLDIWSIDTSSSMDILKAQKILGSSIKNVFLGDKHGTKVWILPWWAWWGISYLPLESFLMKLKTSSYNGFLTLKVRPRELWAWNEAKVIQNLEYMKSYYDKHFLNFK